ncbi:rab-GTPase-TBC domain-containing protein [Xylariaceae sp. FL0255]|nr:rab-GTPase-TBC domain-containing protein [Xylariaceae sp. FL0255]
MATDEISQQTDDGESSTKLEKTLSVSIEESRIRDAYERRDIEELRSIAIQPGGFISDDLRRKAWPILLGFEPDDSTSDRAGGAWKELPHHRDEEQVKLDVDRSFVYYPNDNSEAQLDAKKSELLDLITEVLREQPYLCYFQGYHDICQVLLLVLPPASRARAVSRLSVLRIRDFMLPTLSPAIAHLRLIPDLLRAADPKLCAHLSRNEPYFALSDTLTMFAHNVQRYSDIARLFDALIASEQVFSIYVFTQIVVRRRDELLAHDEPDMLHFFLSKLPPDLDLDAVIADAAQLLKTYPPDSLRAWRGILGASVLKTTRDPKALAGQSLLDGRAFFERQAAELVWAERREKVLHVAYTNRALLLTILVGVGAVYLRKTLVAPGMMAWAMKWWRS